MPQVRMRTQRGIYGSVCVSACVDGRLLYIAAQSEVRA